MVALNFNATAVKPNAGYEPLPTGQYPVMIVSSETKPTKNGQGSYIQLDMQVQGGEHAGKKVTDRLNINNQNQQAVDIAYATLSAICHVTGRLQIQDTSQLHGIPFIAIVSKVKRDDKPDDPEAFSNEIKGYKDMNGNAPGQQNAGGQVGGNGQPQNNGQQGGAPSWAGNGQQGQPQNGVQQQQPQQQPQVTQQSFPNGQQPQNNGAPQGQPQQPQNNGQVAPGAGNTGDAPPWAR